MKRALVAFVGIAGLACLAAAVAWSRADLSTQQQLRIRALDLAHSLGLALPERDLHHMQERSGLQDVSNVNCRNCHGESTNSLAWAQPRPHHAAPGWLAHHPRDDRLFVSLPDLDEVIEIDTRTFDVRRRTRVEGNPSGLAVDPAGESLFVACRSADRVARLDLATFTSTENTYVGVAPVGLACADTTNGLRLVVANSMSDDVSLVATQPLRELTRLAAGREPYGVACAADSPRAYVACRLAVMSELDRPPASELTVVDLVRARVIARPELQSAHLSESTAPVPGRDWVLAPLVRVRNLVPITQVARGWVMSAGLAIADRAGRHVFQVPTDEANRYFADPGAIAVDSLGRRAYVVSAGSDAVTVLDLDRLAAWVAGSNEESQRTAIHDLELAAEFVVARLPTGRNPRQLTLSPDGSRLYVAEYLEDTIAVFDTASLQTVTRIRLGNGGLDDPVRRGERVFTWAGRTFQGQFSCRSCHPDGHVDGLNYDFDGDGIGDNLLDNRSLQGLAGTWPFKWNGKNPSLKVQCGPRFAKVLMRTDPFTGQQLDDLTRYVESLPPPRTRHVLDQEWTASRERGREIFFATQTPSGTPIPVERRCSTCHPPPLYTNRLLSDVGTRSPRDPLEKFDTPHLLGIAASAPYLHDGRSKTLEELWTLYQTNDLHGVSSYMTKQQLNDLVEFLKTL